MNVLGYNSMIYVLGKRKLHKDTRRIHRATQREQGENEQMKAAFLESEIGR